MTGANLTSAILEFDEESEIAEEYLRRGWTDGLPITPPTPDRVLACLAAAGRSPSEIVGTEPTKGRVITAEKIAVNAVMAGCLPEYFPVIVTAVEAMCEPEFNLHAITASTMGAAVLTVVSGPIAKEIGINSGVSVFGPGHRANATIGRAIRLIIINATGSSSGEIDKATLGHPGKFSWCMAEADDVNPWEPMHATRGFDAGDSTVSIFAALSGTQVANHHAQAPEEILVSFRDAMFSVGPTQNELVAVLCPEHIGNIKAAGWSKAQVRQFLFETSQRSDADWRAAGEVVPPNADGSSRMVPVASELDNITILVAGGAAGAFSSIIPLWGAGAGSQSVTKRVQG
ncbi:MAG TPA: hypothetical protein QF520_11245 [SAR202 cluster bacterium]|jgi:hypothetical protein|nr:hypothetical protein [SAR202 cluster bacterium]MDP7413565.1 hypothetical protein [SAR202 cluster bacterium]HJO82963.1 hypothetical protein [SAR202 cluster bacterium]